MSVPAVRSSADTEVSLHSSLSSSHCKHDSLIMSTPFQMSTSCQTHDLYRGTIHRHRCLGFYIISGAFILKRTLVLTS